MIRMAKENSFRKSSGFKIALDCAFFVLIFYIFLVTVINFMSFALGFAIIIFYLVSSFCMLIMGAAIRDLHRVLSRKSTIEQRLAVLEGAVIGDDKK